MKADNLHTAKCMAEGTCFAANPQQACHSDPAHCSWQTSFTMVSPLSRSNETLEHFHPKKVIQSTQGLAKQQLQALLTHAWCNCHKIKQHMSGLLFQARLSHPCYVFTIIFIIIDNNNNNNNNNDNDNNNNNNDSKY